MKIFVRLIIIAGYLLSGVQLWGQNNEVKKILLTNAQNFRIDSLVYYRNPFVTRNFIPLDYEYTPMWLQSYLVNNRPDLIDNIVDSVFKYTHPTMTRDTSIILQSRDGQIEFLSMLKSKNKDLYEYTIGEIWFTEIEKDVSIISVSHFYQEDTKLLDVDMDLDYETYSKVGAVLYVLEDGIAKRMGYSLHKELNLDSYKFCNSSDLQEIKNNISTYTRSYLKDNKRIFETIKNTP